MSCIDAVDIRRYVQGTMDDREADEVTRHLVSCKQCRQLVAESRGTTDPKGAATVKRDERPLVKVRCQKCGARYGIPEDRVRGRMLKIRCKNCSSIIEVWSSEGAIKSVIDRGKKLWFVVVKRERIGPMTEQEVRERFERGEIKTKTYAWRQGFSKWERLRDIPEFKELGGLTPTPRVTSEPTRKAPVPAGGSDPDRTEKARPPRAYVRASERSSEELNFDGLDSLAETAYRDGPGSVPEGSESGLRTAYVPQGSPPAADHQLTHIHLAQRQPVEPEPDGRSDHEMTSKFDAESEASWDRQFRDGSFPEDPAAPPPARPSPRLQSGEWEQHMKGQRREDSVLFSLTHLQNLAAAQAPKGGGRRPDGSSPLLDIRPTLGPAASALLIPEEPGRRRSGVGMILAVAFLGIVLGAGVLLGILYLVQPQLVKALIAGKQLKVVADGRRSPRDSGPALASAAGSSPLAPREPDALAPAPDSGAVDGAPPRPDAPVALAKAKAEPGAGKTVKRASKTPRKRHRRRPGAGGIEVVDPDAEKTDEPPEPVAPPEEPPPEPAKPRPRPKPGGTELDRLIDDATGPGEVRKKPPAPPAAEGGTSPSPSPARAPAPAPAAPEPPKTLTREQVAAGMKLAEPGVHACYQQLREPGLVMITATISGATGRIAAARVVGGFAGTPSGQCVVLAVRRACVFPRFSGPPLTLKYPYMLR